MLELGQMAYYMIDNKVHSAEINCRRIVENHLEHHAHTQEQKQLFATFGPACVEYSTVHGIFTDKELFASREELLESL